MSLLLRMLLLLASVCTILYFLLKIRKAKVQIEDAVFWLLFSALLLLMSLFPNVLGFFANVLSIQSPVNFLFLVMIFLLFMRVFTLTLKVSLLESKLNRLGQEFAIDQGKEASHPDQALPPKTAMADKAEEQ